jgi:N-acetylmuramoyl-L-alanine amidase
VISAYDLALLARASAPENKTAAAASHPDVAPAGSLSGDSSASLGVASSSPDDATSLPGAASSSRAGASSPSQGGATGQAKRAPGDGRKVVALDPGHGGDEVGAAAFGLAEKDSNLDMAFRVKALLEAAGVDVVLTRDSDHRANWTADGPQATGYAAQRLDLQRRVDIANDAGADAFVSLHSNGLSDPSANGVEVWWDSSRPFANENQRLAQSLLELHNRGLEDDVCWRDRGSACFPIFVLGKARTSTRADISRRGSDPSDLGLGPGDETLQSRATAMPGALVENLFITNPVDNAELQNETGRNAIARGVANGILAFLKVGD